MPVKRVPGGYRWGQTGKVYPTKAQAEAQGRAIYASGYRKKPGDRPFCRGKSLSLPCLFTTYRPFGILTAAPVRIRPHGCGFFIPCNPQTAHRTRK